MSDLERSMSAVMGYLTTVESIAEKGAGAASTAAEIRDTLESVAPLHTISADLSVIMDALGRMAG